VDDLERVVDDDVLVKLNDGDVGEHSTETDHVDIIHLTNDTLTDQLTGQQRTLVPDLQRSSTQHVALTRGRTEVVYATYRPLCRWYYLFTVSHSALLSLYLAESGLVFSYSLFHSLSVDKGTLFLL